METAEAIKILLKVSTIWMRQVTDEAAQAEWAECLRRVSFEAALETVRSIRDIGQKEPPTPGEVYLGARQRDERIEDDLRRSRRLLPPPQVTDEQIERNLRPVREFLAKLGKGKKWPNSSGIGS